MLRKRLTLWLIAAALFAAPLSSPVTAAEAAAVSPYAAGDREIEAVEFNWHDAARNRDVPAKIYRPRVLKAPAPVIVFSHGLGGSRNGYSYLGKHWASRGYISIHLQHLGSDDSIFKGGGQLFASLQAAVSNPMNAVNRPKDVTFSLDQITRLNKEAGPWKNAFDLDRIGMSGHSFGALTTMMCIGQHLGPLGSDLKLTDKRIKAAIPMSSPLGRRNNDYDKSYGAIKLPCFHMTGTLDDSPVGESAASDRRVPFDHMPGPDLYLLTFTGGDHMVFSGHGPQLVRNLRLLKGMTGDAALDDEFQKIIQLSSSAFWDAYLLGDKDAEKWLKDGGLKKLVGDRGVLEEKP
jgi:predicted dienelactone hydrolase